MKCEGFVMRAIGFQQFGGPEVFEVLELEEPHAGPGEVRLRVRAAAVSPADAVTRSGAGVAMMRELVPGFVAPEPPYVVGCDAAGVVDEIGPDTDTELAIGDRAIAVIHSMSVSGAYQEYLVVPAASAVHAPKNVDDAAASTLLMNGLTARVALDRLALAPGATVAVTGAAGAVGAYAVQLAKADGLRVAADAAEADEALVRGLGAGIVVRRGPEVAKHIRSEVPEGVDALVDCAVQNDAVLDAVRDGGAIASVRNHQGPSERGITWIPVLYSDYLTNHAVLDKLRSQVESGALTLRVAAIYPAEQAAEAHRRMQAGGVRGRLVLTF
jgi:NADPH:quinone reductase-like Zn-dependent oxidoreductase